MDAARWKQIDELLDAALEVEPDRRSAFVSDRAGDDEDLLIQVMELLKAQREADKFLNNSAMHVAAKAMAEAETEVSAFAFINKRIASYKIERLLGAGGMGEVYLASDERLHRNVALKILPSEYISNDERVKRFELEARAIAKLNHPGIVTVYDVGNFEGVNYIATEFVEGKTLRDLMGGKFKIRNVVLNSVQICDALAAAHAEGIIHRDIKPENIMIRKDGYAKILDFGLAKLTDPDREIARDMFATSKGVIIGTPAYMSPAQITDDKIDHRTDLWSCGVVLYEFLTGTNPFKGANKQETFQNILAKEIDPCSSLNPEVPESLDKILAKLLEKNPDKSYQSAADLRTDLKQVQREIDSFPSWTGSGTAESYEPRRDWPLYGAVAFAAFLVSFAIYYLFFTNPSVPASEWAQANIVQLTFQAGLEAYPSLSPDGRSVAYVADVGSGDDIYLLRIGGSNPMNLTSDSPGRDTMPAFSPDGERIAFRSDREPSGIYIMGATGESPRRIVDFGYSPAWSPDGKHLVVATGHQPIPSVKTRSELWIVDVATGARRMLVDSYALQPSWSPRGDRIAYWTTGASGNRIVETISVNGGEPTVFADAGNTNWNPVFSPDGNYLYFASDRRGNMAFWRSRIDLATGSPEGEAELVPTPAGYNRHIAFSADGKRLAYVQSINRANIRMLDFDPTAEKAMGPPAWITRGDFEFSGIEMSPDGKRFYGRLIKKTQDDIVSLSVDGTDLRDLTDDLYFDRYSALSPDGSRVLFVSDRSGTYQIWVMDADGRNLRQLTPSTAGTASIPVWSPDGKRFSFDNESSTFIADIDSPIDLEKLSRLPPTENGGWFRVWSWSPDGRYLAGNFDSDHGPGMGYYSPETGKYVKLVDYPAIPKWMPDSKRLIFLRDRRPMIADIHTKAVREILPEISDELRNIGTNRDGSKLFYTTIENESDVWLLDLTDGSTRSAKP